MLSKGGTFMKSKYGVLPAVFLAAAALVNSGDATAGDCSWWGRVGYGPNRVRHVEACLDDYTGALRVAFRYPGARGLLNAPAFVVSAQVIAGDAVCVLPPPIPVPLPGPVALPGTPCGAGGLLPPPPPIVGPPPPIVVPPPPPPPLTSIIPIDGFATYDDLAYPGPGNWFYADFDLFPLTDGLCGPGDLDDLAVHATTIYIDGWPFYLNYELPLCGPGFGGP